jgi:hypothetical protein
MNQVVKFDALTYNGAPHGGAVNTGAGTDFNIVFYDNIPQLWYFRPGTIALRGKP